MPDLLTVPELAAALRCSQRWILDRVRQVDGGMPAVRTGRWLFELDRVLIWLREQRDQETARPRRRRRARALVRKTARGGQPRDPVGPARPPVPRGGNIA